MRTAVAATMTSARAPSGPSHLAKWVFGLVLIFSAAAHAGQIYGTIRESGGAVSSGAPVIVTCGGRAHNARTDQGGAFRITVPDGACVLSLPNVSGKPEYRIYSYKDPTRYDLKLIRKSNGGYSIGRR